MSNKTGVVLVSLGALATAMWLASRTRADNGNGDTQLNLYDSEGNPINRRIAGSVSDLGVIPVEEGSYITMDARVVNTSTKRDELWEAELTTKFFVNGALLGAYTNTFAAGQSLVVPYLQPRQILEFPLGSAGNIYNIVVSVWDPDDNPIPGAMDQASVTPLTVEVVYGADVIINY